MMVDGEAVADVTEPQARTPLRPASTMLASTVPATTTAAANAFLLLVFVVGQRHCIAGDVGNSPSSFNETSRLYL